MRGLGVLTAAITTAAVGQASSLPLTILVNAAGTDVPGPAADLSTSDWDRVLAVNLRAPFILARAASLSCAPRAGARSSTCLRLLESAGGPTPRLTAPPSSVWPA